jgi:bacterioferritin (cytochrome b1)
MLRATINHNIIAERRAISDYRQAIRKADQEGDAVASRQFKEILGEEEHHLAELQRLLRTR